MNFSFVKEVKKLVIGDVYFLFFFSLLIIQEIQKGEVELLILLILLPDIYPWSLSH